MEPIASASVEPGHDAHPPAASLGALARIALFYGVAGFGGGYSVLAQLRRDVVERRKWLDEEAFVVLAELSKSLPGTAATSLLALLGQRMQGARGGLVAACLFLLPSVVLMIGCAAAYPLLREVARLAVFFDGMSAAMVGVVAATTIDLAKSALRSRWDAAAAVACGVVLSLHVVTEPMLAVAAIAFGVARAALAHPPSPPTGAAPALPPVPFLLGAGGAAIAGLVRTFAPIGIVTFGGGLAMIPAIERAVVLEQHLIGPHTFADAIALGQITPGPVAICATFIGYRVGGVAGALASTVAMFGPAIALAIAVGRSVDRFRENPFVASALRALAPAVIGMLIAATVSLTRTGVDDLLGAAVAAGALVLLTAARVSPLWALAGGGLVRLLVSLRG